MLVAKPCQPFLFVQVLVADAYILGPFMRLHVERIKSGCLVYAWGNIQCPLSLEGVNNSVLMPWRGDTYWGHRSSTWRMRMVSQSFSDSHVDVRLRYIV